MPTPRPPAPEPSRAAARDRLLAAAEELFYRDGIEATGVDALLARGQVAIGSLYKHFRGKDDLAVAYLDERQRRWMAGWEATIAAAEGPQERCLALFDALGAWREETDVSRGCADVAALVSLPDDHAVAAAARRHKREITDRLAELASETGGPDFAALTAELLVAYDGALARLAVDPASGGPDPVESGRALARMSLASRVPTR